MSWNFHEVFRKVWRFHHLHGFLTISSSGRRGRTPFAPCLAIRCAREASPVLASPCCSRVATLGRPSVPMPRPTRPESPDGALMWQLGSPRSPRQSPLLMNFHENIMKLSWKFHKFHGNLMRISWKPHELSCKVHENIMKFSWDIMENSWEFHENPMKCSWDPVEFSRNPMGHSGNFHEIIVEFS